MTDDSYLDEPIPPPPPGLRPTQAAIRDLRQASGRELDELLTDPDRQYQTVAFLELHKRATRLGCRPEPRILWEQADLAEILIASPAAVEQSWR